MPVTKSPISSAFVGALICAVASFLLFFVLTRLDHTRTGEAIGYGLIVAVIGSVIGFVIGLIIGLTNASVLGGAMIGLLGTVLAFAGFMVLFGGGNNPIQLLKSNWRVIALVIAPPSLVTGLLTAWFRNRR